MPQFHYAGLSAYSKQAIQKGTREGLHVSVPAGTYDVSVEPHPHSKDEYWWIEVGDKLVGKSPQEWRRHADYGEIKIYE